MAFASLIAVQRSINGTVRWEELGQDACPGLCAWTSWFSSLLLVPHLQMVSANDSHPRTSGECDHAGERALTELSTHEVLNES